MYKKYLKPSRTVSTDIRFVIATKHGRILPNPDKTDGVVKSTLKKFIAAGRVPFYTFNAHSERSPIIYYPISECIITKRIVKTTVDISFKKVENFNLDD